MDDEIGFGPCKHPSGLSGNSGEIAVDQDALIRTLRASLAGAEQACDAYIERALRAEAQVSARFSDLRVDYEKLTLLELMERCRSAEEARDAATVRAEKAEAALLAFSERLDRDVAALAEQEDGDA